MFALPSALNACFKDTLLVILSNAMPLQRPSCPGISGSILQQSSNFFPLSLLSLPFFLLIPRSLPLLLNLLIPLDPLSFGAFYTPIGAGGNNNSPAFPHHRNKISRRAFITGVISPIALFHQLSAATPLKWTSVI